MMDPEKANRLITILQNERRDDMHEDLHEIHEIVVQMEKHLTKIRLCIAMGLSPKKIRSHAEEVYAEAEKICSIAEVLVDDETIVEDLEWLRGYFPTEEES